MPVSKRKGRMGNRVFSSEEGDEAEANHLSRLTGHERTRRTASDLGNDLEISAKDRQRGLRIPTIKRRCGAVPLIAYRNLWWVRSVAIDKWTKEIGGSSSREIHLVKVIVIRSSRDT